MIRRSMLPLAVALLGLAGCQDYNFTPVGKCVIQPGSTRFTLGGMATADILFVVDDSGSMQAEQTRLATNFGKFIDRLAAAQAERASAGQPALDFHVAITSSSVFEAWTLGAGAPTCGGAPLTCQVPHSHYTSAPTSVSCATSNAVCNDLISTYMPANVTGGACSYGVGTPGGAYPAGDFVAAGTNPRVLHFTKDLDWSTWGTANVDPRLTALVSQFQANINVGTCGSGMEQHIEAGRLAVKKALRADGLRQPTGVEPGDWPHENSKLVLVFVGDEDDCSSPNDPTRCLAFGAAAPGSDVCTADEGRDESQQTLFRISEYADYFTGLGRPVGAAFVYSAVPSSCQADPAGNVICTPGSCTCQCPPSCNGNCGADASYQGECRIPNECGGKIGLPESRLHQLSAALRGKGANTFEASVCAADWAQTLAGIAELVKPPAGLTLPTEPASSDVVVLRIDAGQTTKKFCTGPGRNADWYFSVCGGDQPTANDGTTSSKCLTINHATGSCEATAGDTYIAQYLSRIPAGGCQTRADCRQALGGTSDAQWECYTPPGATTGTCLCAQ